MSHLTKTGIACLVLAITCVALSCRNPDPELKEAVLVLPATTYDYGLGIANNQIATVGRVLFYDSRLSVNNSVSCSSCHKQALAFADNVSLSAGFKGAKTFRNSMPIQNLQNGGFFGGPAGDVINTDPGFAASPLSLFWDGRETVLNAMVLRPIVNHVEMGIDDLDALATKLAAIPAYQPLFTQAFGDSRIDQDRIASALGMFVGSISSRNSKMDRVHGGLDSLDGLEQIGHQLFFDKYDCNSCHQTQIPNGYQAGGGFINIGLDPTTDTGVQDVTSNPADRGKFKIPTLRNVALTAPYMHDGRFQTLNDVLDHYSGEIEDDPNLDPRLRTAGTNSPIRMNISYADRQAIIAFLNTLTDYTMITDPKFSNPFKTE